MSKFYPKKYPKTKVVQTEKKATRVYLTVDDIKETMKIKPGELFELDCPECRKMFLGVWIGLPPREKHSLYCTAGLFGSQLKAVHKIKASSKELVKRKMLKKIKVLAEL